MYPKVLFWSHCIFCIFTNVFPESIHNQDCDCQVDGEFSKNCQHCGSIVVYADDSTFTVTDNDPNVLSNKLSSKFNLMAEYLTTNMLKVNSDQTQRHRKQQTEVIIRAENNVIRSTESERLLGAYINSNLKWNDHIRDNGNSMLYSLNHRHGALKQIAKAAAFKTRLTIANGIFMSKLTFMISLWAGSADFLIKSLQVCQNSVARTVTRHGRSVSVKQILKECGWRSVKQEIFYHTALMIHKILLQKSPSYLYDQLTADGTYGYVTRRACSSSIRQSKSFTTNLSLCKNSFRWRGVSCYEQLPSSLRAIESINHFKKELDCWLERMFL